MSQVDNPQIKESGGPHCKAPEFLCALLDWKSVHTETTERLPPSALEVLSPVDHGEIWLCGPQGWSQKDVKYEDWSQWLIENKGAKKVLPMVG